MKIEYFEDHIAVSQIVYLNKILQRFGMSQCNPVLLPLDAHHTLQKGSEGEIIVSDVKLYQQMIGSLMYAVTGMRPDLAFTLTLLSQFLTCLTSQHIGTAKRILRYIQGTKEHQLIFPYD